MNGIIRNLSIVFWPKQGRTPLHNAIRLVGVWVLLAHAAVWAAPVRVACVGDSITAGVGTSEGNDYPAQLGRMLGEQYYVANFGVSGSTLLKHGDLPYQKQRAFRKVLAFNPDVVVIKLGTNDTKPQNWRFNDEFVADYKDMIAQFRSLPSKPKIFILYPAPVMRQDQSGVNETRVQHLILMIDKLASDLETGIIDSHSALKDHPEWLPDGVHPDDAGATAIAIVIFRALTGKQYTGVAPVDVPTRNN